MKKLSSLSIFFPSLNDARILPVLVDKAYKTGQKIASDFEIIVVDDGSTDDTPQVLKQLAKSYKNLKTVRHKKNLGYGGALQSGFKNSSKDWVFYTDGDGQYDVAEAAKLVEKLSGDISVVNGYKLKREDPILRKLIGSFYNWVLKMIYQLPISDVDCDFRLIKKSLIDKIKLTSTSGAICLELVIKLQKAGAKFSEVGVHHYKRKFGKSEFFKLKNITNSILDNLKFLLDKKTK